MKRFFVLSLSLFLLTACTPTTPAVPLSSGDDVITKEYIDENIDNFSLDLSNLGLTKIPDFSEIATAVQKEDIIYLNLSNNKITEISDDLLALPNLKQVKLDNNQITKLENIHDIAMLNRLELYKNQIEEVDLKNLPMLRELDLSYNNLGAEDLADIFQINSLVELQLQHNQINAINGVEKLTNLTHLRLESNQLKDVSPLDDMENVKKVTVGNNPLSESVIEKWNGFNKGTEENQEEESSEEQ